MLPGADCLDRVEQPAGFFPRQHRRLALPDDVAGTAHRMGRVRLEHLAHHQPVEQPPQRREVLLDGGRRRGALHLLEKGRHVEGFDRIEPGDAAGLAPGREAPGGHPVGPAGMVVGDLGGEELKHPFGGLGRRRQQRCGGKLGSRRGENIGGHGGGFSAY